MEEKVCNIMFWRERAFEVNRSITEKILRQASETTSIKKPSQSFVAKKGREGTIYAEPVEWAPPTGEHFSEVW